MPKKIELDRGKLSLQDEIEVIYEKTITPFGTGAKIDAPKGVLGRKAYVLIKK